MKGSKTVHTISQILSFFSIERAEIGIREVSQKLGIPPGNVHRLFSAMEAVGFLRKTSDRRYCLGERLFEVGALFPLHLPLRKIIRPHAEDLARISGCNVHVAIPSTIHPHLVTVIDRIQNLQSHPMVQRIALNVPIHCSGIGKAILAFLDEEIREQTLKTIKLLRYTENTITTRRRLEAELKQIRRQGYAVDHCEEYPNVCCVAVPVFQMESLAGSLSLSESPERINEKNIPKLANLLKEKAAFISRQL